MLSFMREQGLGKKGVDKEQGVGEDAREQQEYLTVSSRGKNARKTTYLLAVLFAIGFLSLWVMIQKSTPSAASASNNEESQIESAITRLTGVSSDMFDRMDEIVNKFYEFSDVLQVDVEELAKNPFRYDICLGDLKDSQGKNDGSELEKIRQLHLKKQSQELQLVSIIQSPTGNCCMINDKILYEGDTIKQFTIRKVNNNQVRLESDGLEIILKLAE